MMAKYRNSLPQADSGDIFLTDGGIETCLIFQDGISLPHFAAFDLLRTAEGRDQLRRYYRKFTAIADQHKLGFVLESPTWRASEDWGVRLGYDAESIAIMNREAIALMQELRGDVEKPGVPVVISGCIGPRGDGYIADQAMSVREAELYHARQVDAFRESGADMVTAITMNYAEEAAGIARAAANAGMPVAISFTVETDGALPTGETLEEAITAVDAASDSAPAYYMINCAHPTHFDHLFAGSGDWLDRIQGVRANASTMSHAELDNAEELDDGDPVDLGERYAALRGRHGRLSVLGGCCGTDHRHVGEICLACMAAA